MYQKTKVPVVSSGRTKSAGIPSNSFLNFAHSPSETSSSSSKTCRFRFLTTEIGTCMLCNRYIYVIIWLSPNHIEWSKTRLFQYCMRWLLYTCTQETIYGHPAWSPPSRAWSLSGTCLAWGAFLAKMEVKRFNTGIDQRWRIQLWRGMIDSVWSHAGDPIKHIHVQTTVSNNNSWWMVFL